MSMCTHLFSRLGTSLRDDGAGDENGLKKDPNLFKKTHALTMKSTACSIEKVCVRKALLLHQCVFI